MFSKLPKAKILTLVAMIAVLFSTGCGSSNDDFVAFNNGNNNVNNANAGDLVFRFQRPVVQATVDPATTTLRFDFHSTNPRTETSLVFTESRLYADVIIFNSVPTNVVFVEVTAFNTDGAPLSRFSAPVTVNPLAGTDVVFGVPENLNLESITVDPDPVNLVLTNLFSTDFVPVRINGTFEGQAISLPVNSDTTSFEVDHPLIRVDENGLAFIDSSLLFFGGVMDDDDDIALNVTATATYTLNGVSQQDTFRIDTYLFGSEFTFFPFFIFTGGFPIDQGGSIENWGFGLVRPTGIEDGIDDADLQFELVDAPVPNVTLIDGDLNVAPEAQEGLQFTVNVTYVDDGPGGSGLTFVSTIPFVVSDDMVMVRPDS